ncbi:hypothetical protein BZG36_04287 [Bifiguratus adelaidae]|uniref:N-acetyltransferase domain-containing protein n=1 Tax=Bifiguratus adelaidae TaxID=1938954 RepID=A0A261XWK5_9FUNG|nr:hypothetical protein BZG36_04287 [Bifiguratus adelaidae]
METDSESAARTTMIDRSDLVNGNAPMQITNGNGRLPPVQKPKAIIVGGGIAGLTLANCFLKADIDFVVLERSELADRSHGSNIFLVPNGLRIFDQLGLYEKLKAKGTNALKNDFWEQRGDTVRIWTSMAAYPGQGWEERWGYPQILVYRKDLLVALWTQIDDRHIHCGKKVTNIVETTDKVTAVCDDGSEYTGDFLVGADGAWSHVRRAMYRNIEQEAPHLMTEGDKEGLQCRYHAVFGFSKPMPGLEVNNHFNWMMSKDYLMNTIVTASQEPDTPPRINFGLITRIENPKDGVKLQWTPADANDMSTKYKNLLTPHKGLSFGQMADEADVLKRYSQTVDRWTYGRTILIGDAAHKTSPFNGQGANQSIEGAVILTNVLYHAMQSETQPLTTKNYEEAFNTFVKLRHDRAKWAVEQARLMGNLTTWPNAFWKFAGKTLFQLPFLFSLPILDRYHEIRPVLKVICVAFSTLSDPEPKEATLVAELRAHSSFIPELSLVAELNGELVGHVMCTRATVKTSFCPWSVLALAPLSVVPEHQRQGIGKALMYAIIGAADALHEPFIGVLGDPKYYSRELKAEPPLNANMSFTPLRKGAPKATWTSSLDPDYCRDISLYQAKLIDAAESSFGKESGATAAFANSRDALRNKTSHCRNISGRELFDPSNSASMVSHHRLVENVGTASTEEGPHETRERVHQASRNTSGRTLLIPKVGLTKPPQAWYNTAPSDSATTDATSLVESDVRKIKPRVPRQLVSMISEGEVRDERTRNFKKLQTAIFAAESRLCDIPVLADSDGEDNDQLFRRDRLEKASSPREYGSNSGSDLSEVDGMGAFDGVYDFANLEAQLSNQMENKPEDDKISLFHDNFKHRSHAYLGILAQYVALITYDSKYAIRKDVYRISWHKAIVPFVEFAKSCMKAKEEKIRQARSPSERAREIQQNNALLAAFRKELHHFLISADDIVRDAFTHPVNCLMSCKDDRVRTLAARNVSYLADIARHIAGYCFRQSHADEMTFTKNRLSNFVHSMDQVRMDLPQTGVKQCDTREKAVDAAWRLYEIAQYLDPDCGKYYYSQSLLVSNSRHTPTLQKLKKLFYAVKSVMVSTKICALARENILQIFAQKCINHDHTLEAYFEVQGTLFTRIGLDKFGPTTGGSRFSSLCTSLKYHLRDRQSDANHTASESPSFSFYLHAAPLNISSLYAYNYPTAKLTQYCYIVGSCPLQNAATETQRTVEIVGCLMADAVFLTGLNLTLAMFNHCADIIISTCTQARLMASIENLSVLLDHGSLVYVKVLLRWMALTGICRRASGNHTEDEFSKGRKSTSYWLWDAILTSEIISLYKTLQRFYSSISQLLTTLLQMLPDASKHDLMTRCLIDDAEPVDEREPLMEDYALMGFGWFQSGRKDGEPSIVHRTPSELLESRIQCIVDDAFILSKRDHLLEFDPVEEVFTPYAFCVGDRTTFSTSDRGRYSSIENDTETPNLSPPIAIDNADSFDTFGDTFISQLKSRRHELEYLLSNTGARRAIRHSSREGSRAPAKKSRSMRIVPHNTTLVIDTNCFIADLSSVREVIASKLFRVVVPLAAITELDGLRHNPAPLGKAATCALEYLESCMISTSAHGNNLLIQTSRYNFLPDLSIRTEHIDFGPSGRNLDDVILAVCLWWQGGDYEDKRVAPACLVTADRNLRVKASARDVEVIGIQQICRLVEQAK